jgi:hypothetical protein
MRRILAALVVALTCLVYIITPAAFADSDPVPLDDASLASAITAAADAKSGVRASTNGADVKTTDLWAPQAAFNSLNASITAAKEVLNDAERTQASIDTQTAALSAAIETFKAARAYGSKSDEAAAPEKVLEVFLKNGEPGSDGKHHFVGEDFDSKYKTLEISAKGKTVQLNGYYTTNKSDGTMFETADNGGPLGTVALRWESSDRQTASVSPSGLITPLKDGEVTITATAAEESKYDGKAPSKSVTVKISGQSGAYVSNVTIIDENGRELSEKADADTVISGKNQFYSFYALVMWHDPLAGTDRVEDTRTAAVTSTITWSVGGSSSIGSINADTGRFRSTEYSGNCYVQCSVTGGVGGKTVKDVARVQVDTGEYEYNPAKALTIRIVYEQFPDKVVQEHTWSLAELAARLPVNTYSSTILGNARYGVIRARGYLFKDVLGLENVALDDVHQFRFTTADGYDNPITSQLLYGSGQRYYFPNWDIGSRAGATVVPPLLALESNIMWNESFASPSTPLDSATRFRLVFGPLWGGESNSSFQIYYIQAITVVLKGAPPAGNGTGPDKDSESGGGIGSGVGDSGNGNGSGSGSGAAGQQGDAGQGGGSGNSADSDANSGTEADRLSAGSQEKLSGDDLFGTSRFPGSNFKVYEMISKSKSNVAPLTMDMPYLPIAAPVAGGGLLAGAAAFFIGFRRRLA